MSLSVDYPQPVQVNGYTCRNCSEVDLAKKHIDPAHPASGPFGVNAGSDPSRQADRLRTSSPATDAPARTRASETLGTRVDLSV